MPRLVIVSNRVTSSDSHVGRAGGLAIAMSDALRAQGGLWFGWSGQIAAKTADTADLSKMENITYATVDLGQADYDGYYLGYANSTLWPLLHFQIGLMKYHSEEFRIYQNVNEHFARVLQPLLKPDDVIWVHDYHLIPLGAALRALGVTNRIGFFLHTPFPPEGVLSALPHYDVLLRALDQYDLVGFQTQEGQAAFEDAWQRLSAGPPHAVAGTFPIGIDTAQFSRMARRAMSSSLAHRLVESLGGRKLVIGVDRLDYSKGIPHRLDAIGHFLDNNRDWRGKFGYLQITPHSRNEVEAYRQLRQEIDSLTGRINGQFAEFDWTPIRYLNKTFSRPTLAGFYRTAAVGLVTPLRDGMNLVAKEYVAAQDPESPGCLVLSSFAGAARELDAALLVNPLDREDIAQAVHQALTMSLEERRERWEAMMVGLRSNSILHWREAFLARLTELHLGGEPPEDDQASEPSQDQTEFFALRQTAASHVAELTERQRQVMEMVLAGHPSKNIAADLGISQRTVENHRASIMKKTKANSLPALARLAFVAAWNSNLALAPNGLSMR